MASPWYPSALAGGHFVLAMRPLHPAGDNHSTPATIEARRLHRSTALALPSRGPLPHNDGPARTGGPPHNAGLMSRYGGRPPHSAHRSKQARFGVRSGHGVQAGAHQIVRPASARLRTPLRALPT